MCILCLLAREKFIDDLHPLGVVSEVGDEISPVVVPGIRYGSLGALLHLTRTSGNFLRQDIYVAWR